MTAWVDVFSLFEDDADKCCWWWRRPPCCWAGPVGTSRPSRSWDHHSAQLSSLCAHGQPDFFYFHDFAQIFSQFLQTYCQHFCTMFSQFNLILSQSSGDFTHNFLFMMTIVSRHLNHTVEISEPLVTTCGFQTSACNHCHHHESSWPSWLWASWKSWSDSYLIGDERAVNHLAVGRLPRCTWWWWRWWWWWWWWWWW